MTFEEAAQWQFPNAEVIYREQKRLEPINPHRQSNPHIEWFYHPLNPQVA